MSQSHLTTPRSKSIRILLVLVETQFGPLVMSSTTVCRLVTDNYLKGCTLSMMGTISTSTTPSLDMGFVSTVVHPKTADRMSALSTQSSVQIQ